MSMKGPRIRLGSYTFRYKFQLRKTPPWKKMGNYLVAYSHNAMKTNMRRARKEFEVRVQTFSSDHQPMFAEQIGIDFSTITTIGRIYQVAPGKARSIFWWLEKGTRVRYATVSKNWKSKTWPGRRTSKAGAGNVLFVSRGHPNPGIEPRRWRQAIEDKLEKEVRDRYVKLVGKTLSRKR